MPPRAPWKRSSVLDPSKEGNASHSLGQRLSFPVKAHLAAFLSEFVGTFLFLFVSFSLLHGLPPLHRDRMLMLNSLLVRAWWHSCR